MPSAFFPEEESISSQSQASETESSTLAESCEAIPSINLESRNLEFNPFLEQVLPIDEGLTPNPYRSEPLQAPSIDPDGQELSYSPSRSSSSSSSVSARHPSDAMKRLWVLVLGAAVIALVIVSGLRSQNAPPRRPIPPTRIPQTGAW